MATVCKFFGTKRGCRNGNECPFIHQEPPNRPETKPDSVEHRKPEPEKKSDKKEQRRDGKKSKDRKESEESNQKSLDVIENAPISRPLQQLKRTTVVAVQRPVVSRPQRNQGVDDPRETELSQVIRRFNATRIDAKDSSSLVFGLTPSDPDFPFDLEKLDVRLTVPLLYPGQPAILNVVNEEIPGQLRRNVEKAWKLKMERTKLTLLQHLNWLDRDLEELLVKPPESSIIIVKPGEATITQVEDDCQETEVERDQSSNSNEETEERDIQNTQDSSSLTVKQKGTRISYPDLIMSNISLMTATTVNLILRCSRCKETVDASLTGIKPGQPENPSSLMCPKCSTVITAQFRCELIHMASQILGYLDLVGAQVFDLLPCSYTITCSECGNENKMKSVPRGQPLSQYCHECHTKMTLTIDQVKYTSLEPAQISRKTDAPLPLKQKKKKDEVQLTIGQPLPNSGTCKHYRKSYRWLLFPCCGKLFPCDVCHEEGTLDGHEMKWANRMVCGFCSREQPYHKDKECACGKDVVAKDGKGFWEGGKGTRDRALLNRRDDRKYKGLAKTISNKARSKNK